MSTARKHDDLHTATPDAPDNAPADAHPMPAMMPELQALRVVQAAMARELAERTAQIEELLGPAQYLALLACDRGGYSAETLRQWCKAGTVEAYQDASHHWFADTRSLRAHLSKLGLAKAIRRA